MLRPPEPGSFEALISTIGVPVAELWRLSRFAASEPYFARNGAYRFDDPQGLVTPGTTAFGVLYAAQDPDTAFCESIIHENSLFRDGAYEVSHAVLESRTLVGFRHPTRSRLQMADLTGQGLKQLGLNNDVSAGDDFTRTQAWAAAIHQALPDIAGIRYVSRQNNDAYCYAVFDRGGLELDTWTTVPSSMCRALCKRFNVRPIA